MNLKELKLEGVISENNDSSTHLETKQNTSKQYMGQGKVSKEILKWIELNENVNKSHQNL